MTSSIAAAQSTDVFAESITLTIPSEPLTLDITPTAGGAFQESSEANFSVSTDALAGYTLTINSKNNNNDLVNGENKIQSIEQKISQEQAETTFDKNTWGYLPSKFDSAENSDYQPGPNGTAQTIEKTTQANSGAATSYTIKLGAKVDTTIPYGTYSNTFVLTAMANETTYSITYNLRSGTGGPSNVSNGKTYATTVTVPAGSSDPTREGYEFLGWCSQSPTTSGDTETCGGTTYKRNGSTNNLTPQWTLTGANNTLTLYAMWKKKATDMQNFSCTLSTGEQTQITDSRDGNTYKVAKLKDDKCWMVENLRLGKSGQTMSLSSSDTDISSSYTLPASSTSGFSSNTAENVYVDSQYGGYYTWNAATAGTGSSVSSDGSQASGSICPKGWRLPTKDEYDALVTAYGGNNSTGSEALRATPVPGFVYAGYYSSGSPGYQGSYGYYWSSTAYSSSYAYYLYFYSSLAYAYGLNRYDGFSVRCVAK